MRILVRKMSSLGLLKVEIIIGTIIMAAAVIGLPLGIALTDITLMSNPYVLGVVGIGMLLFSLVGYFIFIRPYILYRKLPAVQVETDGEFLYIHSKKEAKIPLLSLESATVYVELPYILQKEFLSEFIIHIFSEHYGTVILEIPGYGKFKMRFVSNAEDTADNLIRFIKDTLDSTDSAHQW